jgi:hypothetical protein
MKKQIWAIATVAVLAVPVTANAGFLVEGSLGTGFRTDPVDRVPTSVMVAPGWGIADMLKLEAGFNFELGDIENRSFDFQFRPMVVLDPPAFPLYLRAVFVVDNIIEDFATNYGIGGAVGFSLGLAGLSVFGEAGVIPYLEGATVWVVELRAGVSWSM